MKYQLVLQWPASSTQDYDRLIEIEDLLIEKLSESNDVDGHDGGAGEMNIFIHTNDPVAAFEEVKSALVGTDVWFCIRVAYRELNNSEYTSLWPKGLGDFKVA
jgi:hypothetical protein